MKKKWSFKNIVKEVISTLLVLFIVSMVLNYLRQPEINENIYAEKQQDINGNSIHFQAYKGQSLVVHFWATWCPTCKLEASNIDAISKEYNVVTIAVNSGTNEEIKSFLKEKNLTYRVINDASGRLAKKFNIEAYPTTLIYSSKGELKFAEVGYSTTLGLKTRLKLAK